MSPADAALRCRLFASAFRLRHLSTILRRFRLVILLFIFLSPHAARRYAADCPHYAMLMPLFDFFAAAVVCYALFSLHDASLPDIISRRRYAAMLMLIARATRYDVFR